MNNSVVFTLLLIAACATYVSSSDKILVCYYGSWATYRQNLGNFEVENINYNLCTHLIYTFAGINSEGKVISLDPWLDLKENYGRDNFRKFTALKLKKPGLKTLLAVGGWNEGSAKYSTMAADPTLRKNFIESAITIMVDHGFDGLDVDWEYPNQRDSVHGAADVENFTQLLKELREEFDKHDFLLTAAVVSVEEKASISYDIPGISRYLDIVSVMAYDMYGPWDTATGHNSPLHKGSANELYTVDASLEYWLGAGCPREKLVVGIPLYGHTFRLTDSDVNGVDAPSSGPGEAGPYTNTEGFMGYNEFCWKFLTENWDVRNDTTASVPYAVKDSTWLSFDNVGSLVKKVEYGQNFMIAGAMVWSIETDDFHGICGDGDYPLLRAINKALGIEVNYTIETTSSTTQNTGTMSTSSTTPSIVTTTTTEPDTAVCQTEGFARDPNNCNVFYICILSNGELVPNKFQCPENLYWDQQNLYCNYKELVDCV